MAGSAAGAVDSPASPPPHSMQNLASAGFAVPQLGQVAGSADPHDMQNRARSGFSVPQLAQFTGSGYARPPHRKRSPGAKGGSCADTEHDPPFGG